VLPTAIKDRDMPNWKKVIVSGSNVSQLNNDGVYLRTIGDGILSSSAQIATQISGAFNAASASFDARISSIQGASGIYASTGSNSFKGVQTFSGSLLPETTEVFGLGSADYIWAELYVDGQSIYMRDTATSTFVTMSAANGVLTFNNTRVSAPLGFLGGILSSSAQIATQISGAFAATSGGFSTRVTSLEGATSTYALKTAITGAFTAASGGFSTRVTTLENAVNNTTFSASIQERVTYNEIDIAALQVTSSQAVHSIGEGLQPFSISFDRYDGTNQGSALLTNTKAVVYNFTSSANTRLASLEAATSSYALKTAITGAFTAPSASISTRLTALEGAGGTTFSASVSTRLTSVEGYTLDNVTNNGSTTTNAITIGGLTVNGNAVITGKITAQEFNTEYVSSSIIFTSGSTKFGDTSDDIHSFTGSVKLNTQTAATTDTDKFLVFDTDGQIKYRTGTQVLSDINPGGLISSSAQVNHDTTTNFVANEHIDHTTVSITAGAGLLGGGTIAATRTLSINTGSTHFTDGVKKKMNADGVISSSAQVNISSTTGYTTFSSSIATSITNVSNIVNGGGGEFTSITLSPPPPFNQNYATVVSTASGSYVPNGASNYVLDTFYTGSAVEYNYVARNGVKTGRMGTIKVISAFANYPNGEISYFETSTPDMDPVDSSTSGLVFSFDSNGSGLYTGRFLVSNSTGANLIVVFERKEWNIIY